MWSEQYIWIIEEQAIEKSMEIKVKKINWVFQRFFFIVLEDTLIPFFGDFILLNFAHNFSSDHESLGLIISIKPNFEFMIFEFS